MRKRNNRISLTPREDKIKAEYFQWLCNLVDADGPLGNFLILLSKLHEYEFYEKVPNDDNRAVDGADLRREFIGDSCGDYSCLEGPCTVLEMLVALASRIDDILYDPDEGERDPEWFWEMITNLGLDDLDDEHFYARLGDMKVQSACERLTNRTYKRNGEGGLFPLRRPKKDQRRVEIWYQMQAYLDENHPIL